MMHGTNLKKITTDSLGSSHRFRHFNLLTYLLFKLS